MYHNLEEGHFFEPVKGFEEVSHSGMGIVVEPSYSPITIEGYPDGFNKFITGNLPRGNEKVRTYDPFSVAEKLLRDCDSLNLEDENEIMGFCEEYGVFEEARSGFLHARKLNSGQWLAEFKSQVRRIKETVALCIEARKDYDKYIGVVRAINIMLEGVEIKLVPGVRKQKSKEGEILYGVIPEVVYSNLRQAIGIILYKLLLAKELNPYQDILSRCACCGKAMTEKNIRKKWCSPTCRSKGRKKK